MKEYLRQIKTARKPIDLERIIYYVVFDERISHDNCNAILILARIKLNEMKNEMKRIEQQKRRDREFRERLARIQAD